MLDRNSDTEIASETEYIRLIVANCPHGQIPEKMKFYSDCFVLSIC